MESRLTCVCLLLMLAAGSHQKSVEGGKWPDPSTDIYYKALREARARLGGDAVSKHDLDMDKLPLNTAANLGSSVLLKCAVQPPSMTHSIRWVEYATSPDGVPISDNDVIGFHPNAARYEIVGDNQFEFSLRIYDLVLGDGGAYRCFDALAQGTGIKQTHTIGLTVLARAPNCTTTIGLSNIVLLNSYQTNDCLLDYRGPIVPLMQWRGTGDFDQRQTSTDVNIWSGMQFNVTREMDTRNFQCLTEFVDNFSPLPPDYATNVPPYTQLYASRQLYVYWGPIDSTHVITPVKPFYNVGDILTCYADAWPLANYLWQNMRNGVIFQGPTWRVDESWLGFNQSVRCEARNVIQGTNYQIQRFLAVDVPLETTTFPPTTPPTTTPPPAVAPCGDLSGNWRSTEPTNATLCIKLDLNNLGHLTGLLKNGSETFWVDLHGRAQAEKFDQVGMNGVWPSNIGVASLVGECHRCFGVEQILVNVVSRNKGSPCGSSGLIRYTTQYRFQRSPVITCPGYPAPPSI